MMEKLNRETGRLEIKRGRKYRKIRDKEGKLNRETGRSEIKRGRAEAEICEAN
tara:strand:+ start:166 stop:324 length:159 start_codon:yes stop_codon:yes gene_type:complete